MQAELTTAGFQDLHTAQEVENAISRGNNSSSCKLSMWMCSKKCASRKMSLDGAKKPDHLITVFAGVDKEAVDAARQQMFPFLHHHHLWRCSKRRIVHMLERHHIEGRPAEMIAENLQDAYNEHC
jgi:putative YphP/YqiW family bacilliredoxin